MNTVCLVAAIVVLFLTNAVGQAKLLTSDPLTGLPLILATDSGKRLGNMAIIYNEPTQMPGAQVCKSKFQGNFYLLFNIKVDAAVAWYSSHLSGFKGFKKVSGYESRRSHRVLQFGCNGCDYCDGRFRSGGPKHECIFRRL